MKVKNMTSSKGNAVANQFVAESFGHDQNGQKLIEKRIFQSYDSVIVRIAYGVGGCRYNPPVIQLDINKWDYSQTTGKYRNRFLGETKAETQKKINSGEYELVDLN